ncbi:MAG: hypothetical protein J0L92_10090, partial [Deltaproteobacteria bacterium]|nr:hypothetical protein [Deltaproteobacteria bacterium]
ALGAVARAPRPSGPAAAPRPPTAPAEETSDTLDTLDVAMKKHIAKALRATRGRIEGPRGTAAVLGINPHTLRSRMRKLGLDWSQFREG